MFNTILWDFDGTLVNTNDVILESWQVTYEHYLGHRVTKEHITKCFGEPLVQTMLREFPGVDPNEAMEVYRNFQSDHADSMVKAFAGVPEAVRELKEKGYLQCIVTSRTRDTAIRYLKMLDMDGLFDGMVTCEDTDKHKPQPEPILLALDKMGKVAGLDGAVPTENALMIGDGPFDMKCANNAQVKACIVGWREAAAATDLIPDAVIDYEVKDAEELLKLIYES